jgi:hypothetical protein
VGLWAGMLDRASADARENRHGVTFRDTIEAIGYRGATTAGSVTFGATRIAVSLVTSSDRILSLNFARQVRCHLLPDGPSAMTVERRQLTGRFAPLPGSARSGRWTAGRTAVQPTPVLLPRRH